ncbi:hypothetical protein [Nocardia brasiliensis]|nr:hypothetical protein [Nocardia brasiliensis]
MKLTIGGASSRLATVSQELDPAVVIGADGVMRRKPQHHNILEEL